MTILADTSIWIDHFRKSNAELSRSLETGQLYAHPFIIGELALGQIKQRRLIVETMKDLPLAQVMHESEVLFFIDETNLSGSGIGYVDAHLLASAKVSALKIWTKDKRLAAVAASLGLALL